MRVPDGVHRSRPWRVHEVVAGFRLEDVWALPGAGRAEDFPRLVAAVAAYDPARATSAAVRHLFRVRRALGQLLRLDEPDAGVDTRVASVRDRVPADLRAGPPGPEFDALPFTSLYLTEDEWAAEAANRTVHGVLHLGRVVDGTGAARAEMAVYVRPNGLLGEAYLAAIRPFRHLVVWPAVLREGELAWPSGDGQPAQGPAG